MVVYLHVIIGDVMTIPTTEEKGFNKLRNEITRLEEHYFEMLNDYKEHDEGKLARSRGWYRSHYRGLLKAYDILVKKIENEGYEVVNYQSNYVRIYKKPYKNR